MTATVSAPLQTPPVVCTSCGLLCDDLPGPASDHDLAAWSAHLQALCPQAARGIAAAADDGGGALIDGVPVPFEVAVAAAARRLNGARRAVVGGLGGDVQATRAALALADRIGARVVHGQQFVMQHGQFAQQSRGAITTTLAEARNRAELLVIVGGDPTRRFPRLLERLLVAEPPFVKAAARRVLLLAAPPPARLPAGTVVEAVDCGGLDLFDSIAVLRAQLGGRPAPLAGDLAQLAARLQECAYGVLIWSGRDVDCAGGDLLVEQLNQLVVDLNRRTRWAALPLGGSAGDITANAVAGWQTGFSLPVEFAAGKVRYDPFPDYADADLLFWVASLAGVGPPGLPGVSGLPLVVVGAPSVAAALPPEHVFLPTATPGVGSSGHLVRCDAVITLYAPAVLKTALPSAAAVIDAVAGAIEGMRS